jgi:HK97 family phage prohead protease
MAIVKRAYDSEPEIRTGETETLTVGGHAAVFNQRTMIGSAEFGFVEKIGSDAFTDRLEDDVRYLENHDGVTMARTKNGTLSLSVNPVGLAVRANLNPGMVRAQDHYAAVERGDIDQMSFAFTIEDDTIVRLGEDDAEFPGMIERTINKVGRLYDVSGVTYPAYEGADIGVRSMNPRIETEVRAIHDRAAELEIPEVAEAEELEVAEEQDSEVRETPVPENDVPMSGAEIKLRYLVARRQIAEGESSNG